MITGNVKDAGASAFVNLSPGASGKVQAPGGADSFQNILNKQTDTPKRPAGNDGSEKKPAAKKTDADSRLPRRDRTKDVRLQEESAGPAEEVETLSEETLDAAKEAAAQLLFQVSEAFGVSVEELRGLMQEMGISEQELLLPQQFSSLILETGGAKGSFELLTDGALYEKFRSLMEVREQLAGEVSSEAGISREELFQGLRTEGMSVLETQGTQEVTKVLEAQETDPKPETEPVGDMRAEGLQQDTSKAESGRGGSAQENSEGERRESPGGFENNPILRQTTLETAVYEMRTESSSQTMDADTQNIMRQILDYMKVQIRPETTSLEMQLHPASLGTLQIQLVSKGGVVTAQFIAENEAVKTALENQMIQLRESFEEQDIRVEAIEVTVQTGRFEQSYEEQERSGGERQAARGRNSRRIRLDAQLTPEELEDMTEGEKLAADMMAASGGTVDYTA